MRSLVIPFLCVVLVFSLWCASVRHMETTKEELMSVLSDVYSYAAEEDWERTSDRYREFFRIWKNHSNIYSYYMNTNSVDEIDLSVLRCKGYIEAEDAGSTCGELAAIAGRLTLIREESRLSLDNIF